MTSTYKCAYCGSTQTWSGTGPQTCQNCGATQPEKPGSASPGETTSPGPASGKPGRRGTRLTLWLLVIAVVAASAAWLVLRNRGTGSPAKLDAPVVPLHSRMLAVDNPAVRTLPAGSDLSAIDILHSAPADAANLFDTRMLTVAEPRGMNDTQGRLWFVGEVTNHSTDRTAVAPRVEMGIVKGGHVAETRTLDFSDLPPGGHAPVAFTWDGEPREVQHCVFRWKPVQGYLAASPKHPRLQAVVTSRKLTPGTVTVNFSYTYRFITAEVQGTVTNRGDATATGVALYLTLHDAKGHVTGFTRKDLNPIAPGEQVQYSVEAEQWGDPMATLDVEALATMPSEL